MTMDSSSNIDYETIWVDDFPRHMDESIQKVLINVLELFDPKCLTVLISLPSDRLKKFEEVRELTSRPNLWTSSVGDPLRVVDMWCETNSQEDTFVLIACSDEAKRNQLVEKMLVEADFRWGTRPEKIVAAQKALIMEDHEDVLILSKYFSGAGIVLIYKRDTNFPVLEAISILRAAASKAEKPNK